MGFMQRKMNTPLMNPNFLQNLTNSQLFTHSLLSGSTGTSTFDNQSNFLLIEFFGKIRLIF